MKQEEPVKKEEEKVDQAKAQAAATPQEPEEPKESMQERYEKNLEKNYPKTASYWSSFKEIWAETFPDPNAQVNKRMADRKERAKLQREHEEKLAKMTPEEIEEMEANIPEWKRQALVV